MPEDALGSPQGQFYLMVGAVVILGAVMIIVLIRQLGRRGQGRQGDAGAFYDQVEAQMFSTWGWEKRPGAEPWDGEDRIAAPNTDVVF